VTVPSSCIRASLPLVAILLVLTAGPAWADPAGPTHYDSTVTDLVPDVDGVTAEIHGGDSFLTVSVDGTAEEVLVPGYDGEEVYLRFTPDGTVYENRNSATYYQNLDRYGAPVPDTAGADAEPEWVQVSTDGTYAWHDHRIHWMSPTPPDQVQLSADEPQPLYEWEVPLVVAGDPAVISGELVWHPGPAPVVPGVVLVVGLALGLAVAWRSATGAAAVAAISGVLALAVVLSGRVGLPTGADTDPALLPPAVVAVAAPLLALLARSRSAGERAALVAIGGIAAVATVLLDVSALTSPFVPSLLPSVAVRGLLGAVLGLALAALAAAAKTALAALPDLDPDPTPPPPGSA
jgi:hypothetical protein